MESRCALGLRTEGPRRARYAAATESSLYCRALNCAAASFGDTLPQGWAAASLRGTTVFTVQGVAWHRRADSLA